MTEPALQVIAVVGRGGGRAAEAASDFVANDLLASAYKQGAKMPFWYWVIAVVALLWNLLGCAFLSMEVFAQEAMMKSMTEDQKAWARSTPRWIYFVYALAVSTGVAGSIGLFLRMDWTIALFAICLVAVLVQMGYTMIIAGGLRVMGPSGAVMPAVVIVIAAALLGFSWFASGQNWFAEAGPTIESK